MDLGLLTFLDGWNPSHLRYSHRLIDIISTGPAIIPNFDYFLAYDYHLHGGTQGT